MKISFTFIVMLLVGLVLVTSGVVSAHIIEVECPPTKDATVYQRDPDVNFGDVITLGVGKTDLWGEEMVESYIQFDLSPIPSGCEIVSARFEFYCTDENLIYCKDLPVYPVTSTWDEYTITWNNKPVYDQVNECYPDEDLCPGDDNTWYVISDDCGPPCDCELLVQAWVDYRDYGGSPPEAYPNHGVGFTGWSESWEDLEFEQTFVAREQGEPYRPRLIVEYTCNTYDLKGHISNSIDPSVCISGITVKLDPGPSTTTDGSGYYEFLDITPGDYRVCLEENGCVLDWWFSPGSCQEVTIENDNVWVDFEATAHAITIDGTDDVKDTYINCAEGHENDNYCDRTDFAIGNYRESMIRFDVSSIPPDHIILEAAVSLYCGGQENNGNITVEFRQTTSSWTDCAVTCNTAPGYGSVFATDEFHIGDRHYIPLTSPVQNWCSGAVNNGIYMTAAEGFTVDRTVKYSSSEAPYNDRPLLKVAVKEKPKWTILVFINGDGIDVEQYAFEAVDSMETIGSTDDVNIVVQIDRIGGGYITDPDWSETRRYYITQDNTLNTINSVRLPIPEPQERDMGDYHELVDFVTWGIDEYPADHYALIIWSHGDGWYKKDRHAGDEPFLGFSGDETDGGYIGVANGDWKNALTSIYTPFGRKFDVIAFNACLMQMWEVLDITQQYADFVVGSEEKMWAAHGLGYHDFLEVLTAYPDETNAEDLAVLITETSYGDGLGPGTAQRTTSCVETSHMSILLAAMQDFSSELVGVLDNSAHWSTIKGIRSDLRVAEHEFCRDCHLPIMGNHIDLYDFANRIYSTPALPSELCEAAYAVREAVSYAAIWHREMETVEYDYSWAEGIAIYYPIDASEYVSTYVDLPVANSTMWDEFISYYEIVVDEPSGAQPWEVGSHHDIEWHIDIPNQAYIYSLEYSISGPEGPWLSIEPVWGSDSPYDWEIPDTPSEHCHIQICDYTGYPCGISNEFTIAEPVIRLLTPNGGELWKAGGCYDIEWTLDHGQLENVRLEYSDNAGASWNEIEPCIPNSSPYNWCTSGLLLTADCLVRICDCDGSPCDVSNGVFTVADIMVLDPNGSEELYTGCSYPIQFSCQPEGAIGQVVIEYSTNGGGTFQNVVASTECDGEFLWYPIPNEPSSLCLLRISAVDGDPWDQSNDFFSILRDDCCEIRGDINHSGSLPIDISDLIYLINYMFLEGPPPSCMEEADVNADGADVIDIADLVYLIDYMFNEGPAPVPCP